MFDLSNNSDACQDAGNTLPKTVDGRKHGFSDERLERIAPVLKRFVDAGKIPGTVSLVARKGEVVHFETTGLRDIIQNLPMQKDTLFRLYSMTKPVTAVAAMILIEQGELRLDDPVWNFLPAFKEMSVFTGIRDGNVTSEPANSAITIRHLLTHTSGLTYDFIPTPVGKLYQDAEISGSSSPQRYKNLEQWTSALAEQPLLSQPGFEWNYGFGLDVLGRVIEVLTGQGLGEFLEQNIFAPLAMNDTGFWVDSSRAERFAALYIPTSEGGMSQIDQAEVSQYLMGTGLEMGGSGLVGTAANYLQFAHMLLNRGEFGGVRIIAPSSVDMIMSNQLPPSVGEAPLMSLAGPYTARAGLGFGLGGYVITDAGLAGLAVSEGTYSWGGAATTHFWVDPQKHLVGMVMTQLLPDGTYPVVETMMQMTYQALVD
ncbi:MAG: CubicO group peptidase (beta-lactamase class C family) [Bacteroidia bacterium]|jgi:CubicO group peptidase (beta-lactamase class C family)